MRMIFSTVLLPHDPAFTVESFAITQTDCPFTFPIPVTTPSEGNESSIQLAKKASSISRSSSNSNSRRLLTINLPFSSSLASYLPLQTCSIVCLRLFHSSIYDIHNPPHSYKPLYDGFRLSLNACKPSKRS